MTKIGLPVFIPTPTYVNKLPDGIELTLAELCDRAGVVCQASGKWIDRKVILVDSKELFIKAIPSGGAVAIGIAGADDGKRSAMLALHLMAYSVLDVVAKESIRRFHQKNKDCACRILTPC